MTMLSIFEEEIELQAARLKDVPCASCAQVGSRLDGTICDGCGGAGWIVLRDHEPPCYACHHPWRASRPAPRGVWPLPESPISETKENI